MSTGTPRPGGHSDSHRPRRLGKLPPGDKASQSSAANSLWQTRSAAFNPSLVNTDFALLLACDGPTRPEADSDRDSLLRFLAEELGG